MKLWKHQTESVRRFQELIQRDDIAGIGLFHEQGTGKTRTAIECVRSLNIPPKSLKVLVVCPLIVCENWRREVIAANPEYTCEVATGSVIKRLKAFSKFPSFLITNFEATRVGQFWEYVTEYIWDVLIIDESHRIKECRCSATKALMKLAPEIPYRLCLSGTPILNNALDIYNQLKILESGEQNTIGYNFYAFRARYFWDANSYHTRGRFMRYAVWMPRPGSEEELQRIIDERSFRVTKKECLDLPEIVRQTIYVELDPEFKKPYAAMEEHFIAEIKGQVIQSDLAIVKLLRLQQLSAGIINDGETETFHKTPKFEALQELLETITVNAKVIVWANFVSACKAIASHCETAKIPYVTIVGGQTPEQRQAAIDAFQNDPTIRVVIANQAAGGIGINLTAASYMIYFSKNYSLENDLQSEARCHRGGSEIHESITRIDLVCQGTVDEIITDALAKKLSVAELLLDIRNIRR